MGARAGKCIDGKTHTWFIARRANKAGTKVRWQCRKCLHMTPWDRRKVSKEKAA